MCLVAIVILQVKKMKTGDAVLIKYRVAGPGGSPGWFLGRIHFVDDDGVTGRFQLSNYPQWAGIAVIKNLVKVSDKDAFTISLKGGSVFDKEADYYRRKDETETL